MGVGVSSSGAASQSSGNFVCAQSDELGHFLQCKEIYVQDDDSIGRPGAVPGFVDVTRTPATASGAPPLAKNRDAELLVLQEKLQSQAPDQTGSTFDPVPFQGLQQRVAMPSHPLPGDMPPADPVDGVHEQLSLHSVPKDPKHRGQNEGPGRPESIEQTADAAGMQQELGVDIAALLDNNKDDEFIAQILQGEDPALDAVALAKPQQDQGRRTPRTNSQPLNLHPGRSTSNARSALPQESKPAALPPGASTWPTMPSDRSDGEVARILPPTAGFRGPMPNMAALAATLHADSAVHSRPSAVPSFSRHSLAAGSVLMSKSRQGSPNSRRSNGAGMEHSKCELTQADLGILGSTAPMGCERQLIEIALRKMFSKLETLALDQVVDTFREWRLPPSVAIVQQGATIATGPGLCVLLEGVVDVLHKAKGSSDMEKVCTYDRTGQCFGELELIYNTPRPSGASRRTHWATIATRTSVTLWMTSRDAVSAIVHCRQDNGSQHDGPGQPMHLDAADQRRSWTTMSGVPGMTMV